MDIVEFLEARYTEVLKGPGARRVFIDPKGKPCPMDGCNYEIAQHGYEMYSDHFVFRVQHHIWGPMPAPDWYAGERGPSISEHTVPNDLWDTLTRGDYKPEALQVQRRIEALRAILAEHSDQHECTDLAASDYPYMGCRTVKLLASEFEDRPGFNPQWSLT